MVGDHEDTVWVSINPQILKHPEWGDGSAARNCGQVDVETFDGKQRTGNRNTRDAEYVMHGTSIPNALKRLKCNGRMWPTDSPEALGGRGVYTFKVDNYDDINVVMDTLRSCQSGADYKGAAIICKTHGLVFHCKWNDIIPKGS